MPSFLMPSFLTPSSDYVFSLRSCGPVYGREIVLPCISGYSQFTLP